MLLLSWRKKREGQPPLLQEFYETLVLLKIGYRQLDFCEPDFIDWLVFYIGALERRLVALLKSAREEGITAWPTLPLSEKATPNR